MAMDKVYPIVTQGKSAFLTVGLLMTGLGWKQNEGNVMAGKREVAGVYDVPVRKVPPPSRLWRRIRGKSAAVHWDLSS